MKKALIENLNVLTGQGQKYQNNQDKYKGRKVSSRNESHGKVRGQKTLVTDKTQDVAQRN